MSGWKAFYLPGWSRPPSVLYFVLYSICQPFFGFTSSFSFSLSHPSFFLSLLLHIQYFPILNSYCATCTGGAVRVPSCASLSHIHNLRAHVKHQRSYRWIIVIEPQGQIYRWKVLHLPLLLSLLHFLPLFKLIVGILPFLSPSLFFIFLCVSVT